MQKKEGEVMGILHVGVNDLGTTHPDIAMEWDYVKNGNLTPQDVTAGSGRKVWWICSKGHSYQTNISSRAKGCGCPVCSGKVVVEGVNDLTTTHPELLKIWNYKRNDISPEKVSFGSHRKVWWACAEGHEFEAPISRISRGGKCPYCTNEKVLKGYNDLQSVMPEVLQYWDFDKNMIKPDEVAVHSNKKAWFKCDKGHSYHIVISSKTRGNIHSCPICNVYKRTSVPEKIIYYYVKKKFDNAVENYKPNWLKPKEIDVYIPELKVGIEYDGYKYHDDVSVDLAKDELCYQNGVELIRIRELECPIYESSAKFLNIAVHYKNNFSHMEDVLNELFMLLGVENDINIHKDYDDIMNVVNVGNKENCIAFTHPEVLKEWDYERNDLMNLTPNSVTEGSAIKVWWKCEKGHSYQMAVNKKIYRKDNCPYCSNKKTLKGFNDLATTHPHLIREWDYDKNKDISPDEVVYGSNKKIHWICSTCGNRWEASIVNRAKGSGCPYCDKKKTLKGINDLATVNPSLASEWNHEKNGELKPSDVTVGSGKKVWWRCKNGHEWEAVVSNRAKGIGCPYCSGKRVISGVNDLATKNPELAKQWHPTKNGDLKPSNVMANSAKKVWWLCTECGHEWEAQINNRNNRYKGEGCSRCYMKKE